MTEMDELKPCPFCGRSDKLKVAPYRADDDGGAPFDWGFTVLCSAHGFAHNPDRGCGSSGGWGETEAEAIEAWNRRPSLSPAGVTEEQRDMIEQIVSGTAPMSKWMGSVDYSTFDGFETYLEGQLREKLSLKVTLDKEREHSAESESLATFVDGAIGVIESALVTFRTVREREAAAKAQPSAASDGWQDISTARARPLPADAKGDA